MERKTNERHTHRNIIKKRQYAYNTFHVYVDILRKTNSSVMLSYANIHLLSSGAISQRRHQTPPPRHDQLTLESPLGTKQQESEDVDIKSCPKWRQGIQIPDSALRNATPTHPVNEISSRSANSQNGSENDHHSETASGVPSDRIAAAHSVGCEALYQQVIDLQLQASDASEICKDDNHEMVPSKAKVTGHVQENCDANVLGEGGNPAPMVENLSKFEDSESNIDGKSENIPGSIRGDDLSRFTECGVRVEPETPTDAHPVEDSCGLVVLEKQSNVLVNQPNGQAGTEGGNISHDLSIAPGDITKITEPKQSATEPESNQQKTNPSKEQGGPFTDTESRQGKEYGPAHRERKNSVASLISKFSCDPPTGETEQNQR